MLQVRLNIQRVRRVTQYTASRVMEGSILTQKVTYSTRKRILYMYMLHNFAILSRMNRIDGHVVRKSNIYCMYAERITAKQCGAVD